MMEHLNAIDDMVIEPLSDEMLDSIAGASSTGPICCSCAGCSGGGPNCTCAECTGGTGPKLPTGGSGEA